MSIGVGVLCRDAWILLFADRQIGTGDFKFYQRKISLIGLSRGIVGYTYAGLSDVNNTVFEEFGKRIRDADMTVAEVKRELQKTLNAVLNEQTSPFQMLVGVDSERPAMFKTFDKAISPVYLHDFIGFGDSALVSIYPQPFSKPTRTPGSNRPCCLASTSFHRQKNTSTAVVGILTLSGCFAEMPTNCHLVH